MSEDVITDKLQAQPTGTTPASSTMSTTGDPYAPVLLTSSSVKPGWKTSEFCLALAAKLLGAAFAVGFLGDGSSLARLGGMAAVVLSSLGYTVSRTMIKTAAMLCLFVGIVHTQTACATLKSGGKAVASDAIDCTKAEAMKAITQFAPVVDALLVYSTGGDGKIDTAALKSASKSFARDVGGCVVADAIVRALKPAPADPNAPKSSPLVADPVSLRAAIADLYPGASFHTASGDLSQ
jgi:hypothetical protein